MIDSRNGRILDSGERMMIGEREFAWLETQATDGLDELDHLMLASSVPWLMPPAIGDLEAVNERNADRPGRRGRLAEKTRRAVDFEHWPAFHKSFLHLAEIIARVASHPNGPTTVSVLSGDVHHSYAARAEWAGGSAQSLGATVHQLVLAGEQLCAAVPQTGVHAELVASRGRARPVVVTPTRRHSASAVLGEHLRSIVRETRLPPCKWMAATPRCFRTATRPGCAGRSWPRAAQSNVLTPTLRTPRGCATPRAHKR
jgi:hypothetical protein